MPSCQGISCHLSCEGKKLPYILWRHKLPYIFLAQLWVCEPTFSTTCSKEDRAIFVPTTVSQKCIKNACYIVNYKYFMKCVWLTVVYNYNILTVHNTNLPWPLIIRMCLNYVHHHHQSRFRNCFKKEIYSECSLLTPLFIINAQCCHNKDVSTLLNY